MTYAVKEIYYTLQGEGAQAGRAAVFCASPAAICGPAGSRTAPTAVCKFCDTDFVGTDGPGGGKFATAEALADAVARQMAQGERAQPYVVCTGGEPLLQLDEALIARAARARLRDRVETNGTLSPPPGIDWICVSPKADAELAADRGNELKLVYPQDGAEPERYAGLDFDALLPAADGRPRRATPTPAPRSNIALRIRNGG